MNTMTYRGFTAHIDYDDRDRLLIGHVLGLPDTVRISFQGETVAELTDDFHNAVDFYLQECADSGREPMKPASGKLMLRVPPEVHGAALVAAQAAGTSLNQWAAKVLAEAALTR
ncbi:type II toxin-antitoxin system HicB family antitoxin [Thiohalocapsa marina]|uniref:Type II toxin-antitoxin system HicB family antitoxin n=1 Tax=Thiohalocapsa marina TaxID=424902 RepID=A0A5M8FHQ0_9GAMM|nr:type II toxin-antitoxin system HicB family antitoxin [Thiohalocapsa marina]KAA6184257.1 type II toxin-antitoxin system HicB family antitoxin [Thiohalocapsa marina]